MPRPVAEWLEERASYMGWPPAGVEWRGVLRDRTIDDWKSLNWENRSLRLDRDALNRQSWLMVKGLVDAYWCGETNAFSSQEWLTCSHEKYESIGAYISDHQRIPGDLIFLEDGETLDIVDGCHRLAFFFVLQEQGADQALLEHDYDVWVGFRPDDLRRGLTSGSS